MNRGKPKHSLIAKTITCQVALSCAHKSNQIHGGYGYFKEYAIEHLYRDQLFADLFWSNPIEQRLEIANIILDEQ